MLARILSVALVVGAAIGCAGRHGSAGTTSQAVPRPASGPELCPPVSIEPLLGHQQPGTQLAHFVLKDCDDHDVALDHFCGADALWIFAAHGWCPHCEAATGESESIMASFALGNVAAVNVLVESPDGQPPTAADCKAWASRFGLGRSVVPLYDPTGMALLKLWDGPMTALSVFVGKDRVITGKTHSDDASVLRAGIESARAH